MINSVQTPRVDAIVLSFAKDQNYFNKTKRCVESYLKSAHVKHVFVVETNSSFDAEYGSNRVSVIKPKEKFNYNKFYNIALNQCTAEFVIGPNNDLVVEENCIEKLLQAFDNNQHIDSLCPIDRKWHRHSTMYLPTEDKIYHGYETSLHMFGCIFMCRRKMFERIGLLDERFFFFYQDNDYIMSLQRLGIIHGVYTGARVSHESGGSNEIAVDNCCYTNKNMIEQGNIFNNKWFNEEPFKSGGYKQYKSYDATFLQ